ncbi:MAG: ATP-binding cassette domain-containing protein [Sedimentisphaerales bacterium]|nr:ATP-binding cassette domain-containing protein [Sedimentisphaerales bacterium]
MSHAAIDISNLRVQIDGQTILHDFSLAVDPGQKIALTGSSGGGKSTLLRCILGFVEPQEGQILISGHLLTGHSVWSLRHRMGYVAQEPDLGSTTVQEVLHRPFLYQANLHLAGNLDRLPDWLKRFGLNEGILSKQVGSLSGGEKQRIGLISALLLEREILLLDEISSALDKENRQAVVEALKNVQATMVIITHDEAIFELADNVVKIQPVGEGAGV